MKNNYVALGGLFASLHVLFLFLSKVIVGSELLLVLFLPLLSTLYTIKSDKKSVVMFSVATVLICSIFDIVGTFIYVIPSLACGVLYGVLRKKNFKELELLCFSSIGHVFSLLFSFFVITLIFKEVKFIEIFSSIFGVDGDNLIVLSACFFIVLGFCEAFLVHVVSDNELAKFASRVGKNDGVPIVFLYSFLVNFVFFIVLYFVNNLYSVIPMILMIVFVMPYIVNGILNLKYKILTIILIFVFSLFSIFVLNYIETINVIIIPVFIVSPFVINNFQYKGVKNF